MYTHTHDTPHKTNETRVIEENDIKSLDAYITECFKVFKQETHFIVPCFYHCYKILLIKV